jgi:hypothetical protein
MPLVVKDRVRETTVTTGTGTVTLAGPVAGFQSFSVIGDANTTYYAIVDAVAGTWEVGLGTYTAAGSGTLARTTVLESSNGGALVPFGSGTKDVFCTYPADRSVYADGSTLATPAANLTVNGIPYASSTSALTTGSAFTFSSGNVGIGTTAPASRLHVSDAGSVADNCFNVSTPANDNVLVGANLVVDAAGTYTKPATSLSGAGILFAGINNLNAYGTISFLSAPDTNTGSATPITQMIIDADGNVGVGTTAPLTKLNVNGTDGELIRISVTSDAGVIQEPALGFATGVTNTHPAAKISALEFDASDSRASLLFYTRDSNSDVAPTERMRLNSSGQLILNTTGTAYATGGVTAQYQIGGTTQAASSMSLITSSATTTTDPTIFLAKNKSGTQGTFTTAVVNTDELGAIRFAGSNTSTLATGAEIKGVATGTWTTGSQPTDLVFSTVSGGTTTLDEAMRLTQNQEVLVGAGASGVTEVVGYGLTSMSSAGGYLNLYRNDTTVVSGNALGTIDFYSNGSGSILYAATFEVEAGGTFTASSTPTEFVFFTCPSGSTTTAEAVRIKSGGGLQISRTAVTAPATGDGNVFSGTYSPALTNGTNITNSAIATIQYLRVGSTVTVSGNVTAITTTAAGNSLISISLPIASTFGSIGNCNGTAVFYSGTFRSTACAIYADTTNNIAIVNFTAPSGTTGQAFSFHFTYRII